MRGTAFPSASGPSVHIPYLDRFHGPKVRLGHNEVLQPGEQEEGREDGHSGGGEEADADGVRHAEGGTGLQAGWLTARAPRVLAPQSAI